MTPNYTGFAIYDFSLTRGSCLSGELTSYHYMGEGCEFNLALFFGENRFFAFTKITFKGPLLFIYLGTFLLYTLIYINTVFIH